MGHVKPMMSRRFALAAMSALSGVAAAGVTESKAHARSASSDDLLRPLEPGSRFGRWELERIGPLVQGAITLSVRGASGTFQLEILARDPSPSMPRAPGSTEKFAVHVVNSGNGTSPTDEDHGLCAMTLAAFIAKNEGDLTAERFATLAHRLDLERRGLLRR
jgi:hypothetical protein